MFVSRKSSNSLKNFNSFSNFSNQVPLAIFLSNAGGAFDNAKKHIEAGGLGDGVGKNSAPHKGMFLCFFQFLL